MNSHAKANTSTNIRATANFHAKQGPASDAHAARSSLFPSSALRWAFLGDAVISLAVGLGQLGFADRLSLLFQVSASVLTETGAFMALYGALLIVTARRERLPSAFVALITFGNVGWALMCFGLLASHALGQSAAGSAFLCVHIVHVLVWASLQWRGWQRSARTAPTA